jgi:hypothetical protein
MYGLPQSTEIKKQLPKKAIFANFELKLKGIKWLNFGELFI